MAFAATRNERKLSARRQFSSRFGWKAVDALATGMAVEPASIRGPWRRNPKGQDGNPLGGTFHAGSLQSYRGEDLSAKWLGRHIGMKAIIGEISAR
jgi:hypothetical protein